MILLDTHIWLWWVHHPDFITQSQKAAIESNEKSGIGVSVISCWEIAKLIEYKRLELTVEISEWFDKALSYPGIQLLGLTPRIAIESTQLPGKFHRDPADQIIVATARILNCPLACIIHKIFLRQNNLRAE